MPRRCMLVSSALMLAGLLLPLLMLVGWLPATLLTGFASLALMGLGANLAVTLCGEL